MTLSPQETEVVARILRRFASPKLEVFRSGGRAVAAQIAERRLELIRALRAGIDELGEQPIEEWRRGYLEALKDTLLAAEAAFDPR